MTEEITFCRGGGCTAKLGPDLLSHVLSKIPKGEKDPDLLIGYDSKDDAAVYRISDDTAVVQTLDFFPPMLDDPYLFGQIAAANALSDIYAMGAQPKLALNIMAVSPQMPDEAVREVLRGESWITNAYENLAFVTLGTIPHFTYLLPDPADTVLEIEYKEACL